MKKVSFLLLALVLPSLYEAALPTVYEYYTSDGISSGLSADQPYFTLNGKNISIYSGAIHYFRVPHQYWRDRLRKLRASGCNTVETYAPWNLHEPENGVFDFGDLVDSRYNNLNVTDFFRIAQEEDLFVLFRPGPYICAEWEFGGLPSWLLRNKETIVRTSEKTYVEHVTNYYNRLLPLIKNYQFTNGGPIIGLQVENEYGHVTTSDFNPDKEYLQILVDLFRNNSINELLYTSDSAYRGTLGSLPGELLQTVNFGSGAAGEFNSLQTFQQDKPIMAMEFWTGWYDSWSNAHSVRDNDDFRNVYKEILTYPASVNMYMFHGGTNFGFLNGANEIAEGNSQDVPLTTSYDYDSPLSENGDYTEKYEIVAELLKEYNPVEFLTPDRPALVQRVAYPEISVSEQIFLKEIYDSYSDKIFSENPIPMELLPINNNNGQSYGYTVYQKILDLPANSTLTITDYVCDTVMVLVNGNLVSKPLEDSSDLDGFGYWRLKDSSLVLTDTELRNASLELIVENLGRVNFGPISYFKSYKGLNQDVLLNDEVLTDWYIIPLEFKQSFNQELSGWHEVDTSEIKPALYRATFEINEEPVDTYIDVQDWTKGIVILNGFVLGRHFKVGPTQALYVPGPYLNKGSNEIIIFEQFKPSDTIKFSTDMTYYTNEGYSLMNNYLPLMVLGVLINIFNNN